MDKTWCKGLKAKARSREPLRRYTTLRIGGPAKYFVEPQDEDDLKLLLNFSKRAKIPALVIGSGSNILADDRGMNGIVLRLSAGDFKNVRFLGKAVASGAGVRVNELIARAKETNFSGAEFLSGMPGTVGGAIVMNAGNRFGAMGDIVEEVTVMDRNGKIETFNRDKLDFGYRRSNLGDYIILSARLKMFKDKKERIQAKIKECLRYRKDTQDLSKPSAGCVFKNPRGDSAGRLIDLCGLKGARIGGACVSEIHANFILNFQNARSRDFFALMKLIREKVRQRFGITLEPEIKIWQ